MLQHYFIAVSLYGLQYSYKMITSTCFSRLPKLKNGLSLEVKNVLSCMKLSTKVQASWLWKIIGFKLNYGWKRRLLPQSDVKILIIYLTFKCLALSICFNNMRILHIFLCLCLVFSIAPAVLIYWYWIWHWCNTKIWVKRSLKKRKKN
jgi:hypothetical protein